jgi:hypothetical protein
VSVGAPPVLKMGEASASSLPQCRCVSSMRLQRSKLNLNLQGLSDGVTKSGDDANAVRQQVVNGRASEKLDSARHVTNFGTGDVRPRFDSRVFLEIERFYSVYRFGLGR